MIAVIPNQPTEIVTSSELLSLYRRLDLSLLLRKTDCQAAAEQKQLSHDFSTFSRVVLVNFPASKQKFFVFLVFSRYGFLLACLLQAVGLQFSTSPDISLRLLSCKSSAWNISLRLSKWSVGVVYTFEMIRQKLRMQSLTHFILELWK